MRHARERSVVTSDRTREEVEEMPRRAAQPADADLARLTSRQQSVLALMAEGLSNAAISEALMITQKSVVEHASHIYELLQLPRTGNEHRRVLAVRRYLTTSQTVTPGADTSTVV